MREPLTSYQRDCITEQEKQSVLKLHEVCLAKGTKDESIFEFVESLIYEVGKNFLSTDFRVIHLGNDCFVEDKAKNVTNTIKRFGLDLGEVVLRLFVCQCEGNRTALAKKILERPSLSNVLIVFMDKKEILIQLWKEKQKKR